MPNKNVPETPFRTAVVSVVRSIPRGTTMSYQSVAIAAGYPRAARAVAQVMAHNYDPTVPCHRVIKRDGSLGGYNRGGAARKQAILRDEGVHTV